MQNYLIEHEPFLFLLNSSCLKKKSIYSKKIINSILQLRSVLNKKQKYRRGLSIFLKKDSDNINANEPFFVCKKRTIVLYSICFSFSPVNTFLYVTDALGSLKFTYSAGSLGFKGKSKKIRFVVLKLFFKKLRMLKLSTLKNKPVSLILKDVGSYRSQIIRKLKKNFFIQVVKNYQTHSYNGCRYKKKSRK